MKIDPNKRVKKCCTGNNHMFIAALPCNVIAPDTIKVPKTNFSFS